MAGAFLPPDAPFQIDQINTSVVADGDTVRIGVELVDLPEVQMALEQGLDVLDNVFPDNCNKEVHAEIGINNSFDRIAEGFLKAQNAANPLKLILEGFYIFLKAQFASAVMKTLREAFFAQGPSGQMFEGLAVFLFMLKGTNFQMNFGKTGGPFLDGLIPGGPNALKQQAEMMKPMIAQAVTSIPFITEFLTVAVEHIKGDISISAVTKSAVGEIGVVSEGFADIYEWIIS
mmetsp:Transcript_384/g.541  ORF Transcript_384/g.541 Transcript_384/m.541 type:complete len:231 (+) Transcript_384:502-1194(+)